MDIKQSAAYDFSIETPQGLTFNFTSITGASRHEAILKLRAALEEAGKQLDVEIKNPSVRPF